MDTPVATPTTPDIAPPALRTLLGDRRRRTCLCCGKPFNSLHIGNRVCLPCKAKNARCGRLKGMLVR